MRIWPPAWIWYQSFVDCESVQIGEPNNACIATISRLATTLALAACSSQALRGYQGYVEGEFVDVRRRSAGRLDQLSVERGDQVAVNARLYALEAVSEAAAQRRRSSR